MNQQNLAVPISSLPPAAVPQPQWLVPVVGYDSIAGVWRPYSVTVSNMLAHGIAASTIVNDSNLPGATVKDAFNNIHIPAVFATLTAAINGAIVPGDTIIKTNGRSTPGDNGGATYIELVGALVTPPGGFQNVANSKRYALSSTTITPEMFGAQANIDCGPVFQLIEAFLNMNSGQGGYTISAKPGAEYKIWPQSLGAPQFNLMLLNNINSLTWNFNGSKFSTDNLFPSGAAGVIGLAHCTDITFNDPWYVETAWTALSNTAGGHFLTIAETTAPWSENIKFNNIKQNGGSAGLTVSGHAESGGFADNIEINNAVFKNVFYGMNFQGSGNNFTARGVIGDYNGRLYFPTSVSHHDVEMIGKGGVDTQVLLKVYALPKMTEERRQLSDIRVRYRSVDSYTPGAELSNISFQQSVNQLAVSGAANNGAGKVRLTVNSTADMLTGQKWYFNSIGGTTEANGTFAVTVIDATHIDLLSVPFVHAYTAGGYGRVPAVIKDITFKITAANDDLHGMSVLATSKFTSAGAVDTVPSGYEVSNVTISGSVIKFNDVAANAPMFSIFSSAWAGDVINNFSFRDLVLKGTGSISITAPEATSTINLENIVSLDSTLVWSLGGVSTGFNVVNVQANGIADRNTVTPATAPASQYAYSIDANGGILFRQPAAAELSDGNTGTGAVAHATNPVFVTPNLGTPSALVATNATGTAAGLTAGNTTTNANMSGDVSSVGNVTTIGAHKVLRSMEAQGVARSVVGVTGNATADIADIQGTASQFFGINAAGTALAFQTMSGDATLSGGAITVSKTGGVNFGTLATLTPGTGIATALGINVGTAGAPVINGGALGSPSSAGTLPAHTLGGTISGGGNQINNVVLGAVTPLAATVTTLQANTSVNAGAAIAADALLTANSNTAAASASFSFGVAQLHLIGQDSQIGGAYSDVYGAQGVYMNRYTGGTQAAKVAAAAAATGFSFFGQHWDGAGYFTSAAIDIMTSNAQSGTDHSGQVRIRTVPNGSTTLASSTMFQNSGGVSIGATAIASDPGIGNLSVSNALQVGSFTVATLPAGIAGRVVFCSNCRVFNGAGVQEGAGAGTGGHVSYNGSAWKIAGTNSTAVA